jgi:tetratricopeptide (TPR) repeat protein
MPVAFTDAARRRFAAASIVGLAVALALPLRWQAADIRLGEAVAAARAGHYADAALYAQQSDVWGARRRLEARYVAGSALLAANRPEEAMDLFAALELEAPVFAQLQLQIGRVQLKMGRPQEAYDYFTRQRELTPTLVPALEGLAVAAKETGRLDEARKALLAAISLRPDDAVLYLSLADIYKRENNKAEARALEQRVKKLRREEKPSRSGRDG